MRQTTTASSWCAIAKIRESTPFGEEGKETKIGSKHFKPGAKVYIIGWHQGSCTTVRIVGHHRMSKKLMTLDMNCKYLTDLRSKVVYKPYVLQKIEEGKLGYGPTLSEEEVEEIKTTVEKWIQYESNT